MGPRRPAASGRVGRSSARRPGLPGAARRRRQCGVACGHVTGAAGTRDARRGAETADPQRGADAIVDRAQGIERRSACHRSRRHRVGRVERRLCGRSSRRGDGRSWSAALDRGRIRRAAPGSPRRCAGTCCERTAQGGASGGCVDRGVRPAGDAASRVTASVGRRRQPAPRPTRPSRLRAGRRCRASRRHRTLRPGDQLSARSPGGRAGRRSAADGRGGAARTTFRSDRRRRWNCAAVAGAGRAPLAARGAPSGHVRPAVDGQAPRSEAGQRETHRRRARTPSADRLSPRLRSDSGDPSHRDSDANDLDRCCMGS